MAKTKSQQPAQTADVVDELIPLPEEHQHLCTAETDEGESEGYLRIVLNREVLDIMQDIVDELELSRELPVNARDVSVADPVVVKILQSEKMDVRDAIEKAVGWYQRQKQQVSNDALIVALTLYNEINIVPTPYRPGETAFSVRDTASHRRTLPKWMHSRASVEIPLPERRLTNTYEMRLKQVYDLSNACGAVWALQFRAAFERGIANTIQLIEPRDDAGFQPEPSGSKVSQKSGATNKNSGNDE